MITLVFPFFTLAVIPKTGGEHFFLLFCLFFRLQKNPLEFFSQLKKIFLGFVGNVTSKLWEKGIVGGPLSVEHSSYLSPNFFLAPQIHFPKVCFFEKKKKPKIGD